MRHVAAYLLLKIGGNDSPSAADIKTLLGTVSVDVEDARLNQLISELEGKNVEEIVAEGKALLAK